MNTITCNISVAVNEDGDWVVVKDDDEIAIDKLAEEYGGSRCRVIALNVTITPPKPVTLDVTVPDEPAGPVSVTMD